MSLGVVYHKQEKFDEAYKYYKNALNAKEDLAKSNPYLYNADIASILNNIAVLHKDNNEFIEAEQLYLNAISIGKKLSKSNPQEFIPSLCLSLINLGEFYKESIEKKNKSIELIQEAFDNYNVLKEIPPNSLEHIKGAFKILNSWGIDVNDFLNINYEEHSIILATWENSKK